MARLDPSKDQLLFLLRRAPIAYEALIRERPHLALPALITQRTVAPPLHNSTSTPASSSTQSNNIPEPFPRFTLSHVTMPLQSSPTITHTTRLTPLPIIRRRITRSSGRSPPSLRDIPRNTSHTNLPSSLQMALDLRKNPARPITTQFARDFYHCLDRYLDHVSLKEPTKKVYLTAFKRFQETIDVNTLSLTNFDDNLANYGEQLFEDDPRPTSRSQVQRMKAFALIAHPELKGNLHRTKRILKSWQKLKPTTSATPVSREVMLAFSHFFLTRGKRPAAICMLLSWGGLLRVSEARNLKRKDVSLPTDLRTYSIRSQDIEISLHDTKTGPDQYCFISDTIIVKILQSLLQHISPSQPIIPIAYATYSADLTCASTFFGLEDLKITSHCNRIGGALHLFMNKVAVADIAVAGRWASLTSLNHYLINGRTWLANIRMSQASHDKIHMHFTKAVAWPSTNSH